MIRSLIACAALLLAAPVAAQDWVTPETCAITPGLIDETALTPPGLDALKAEANAISNGVGRFWQITAPDGAVSHLFGTTHSTDPHILRLSPQVEDAIATSRIIAPEVDFRLASRADYEDRFQTEYLFRSEPRSLQTLSLPREMISWIEARLETQGYGEGSGEWLTMAGLINTLLADPCDDFTAGVLPIQDDRILMLGLINGAAVKGLEAREDILRILSREDRQDTALAILSVYAAYLSPQLPDKLRDTSFALYKSGQIGVAMALDYHVVARTLGKQKAAPALALTNGYLLDERNASFLATIRTDLNQGGVFMAIGNFHLPGENGMVSMLRKAGFKVDRIPLPGEIP